ncbi:hypothetical protein OG535_18675 [Kitasatospora sp. NBC_00085]|uniref:hypothetical protein n=1 Tax=unclassified Kitasatospora TaxID=2633591 RepID=UPI003255DD99
MSMLGRMTAHDRRRAADAFDDFQATLAAAGLTLPSAGVDWRSARTTGVVLIDLGAVRADVIERLTDLIRKGLRG